MYGRAHVEQTTLEAFGFNACGDRLCFLGIAPGVTRWSKALATLESHGARQRTLQEDVYFIDHLRINIEYDPQTQLVTYLAIIDQAGAPLPITLGDFVRYLGTPCRFTIQVYSPRYLEIVFQRAYLTLSMDSPALSPNMLIPFIEMNSTGEVCTNGAAWPGFTTPDRYLGLWMNQPH